MKSPLPSVDWQPPLWIAFVFCIVFAVVGIVALFLGAPAQALAVDAGLFALCFRTAYRRPKSASGSGDSELGLLGELSEGIERVKAMSTGVVDTRQAEPIKRT